MSGGLKMKFKIRSFDFEEKKTIKNVEKQFEELSSRVGDIEADEILNRPDKIVEIEKFKIENFKEIEETVASLGHTTKVSLYFKDKNSFDLFCKYFKINKYMGFNVRKIDLLLFFLELIESGVIKYTDKKSEIELFFGGKSYKRITEYGKMVDSEIRGYENEEDETRPEKCQECILQKNNG